MEILGRAARTLLRQVDQKEKEEVVGYRTAAARKTPP